MTDKDKTGGERQSRLRRRRLESLTMAPRIYRQYYADGSSELRRRIVPQGRKPHSELRMVRTNITISREGKSIIKAKAAAMGMSFSAYLELAGILYTPELVNT